MRAWLIKFLGMVQHICKSSYIARYAAVLSTLLISHARSQCQEGSCVCTTSSGTINLTSIAVNSDYSLSGVYGDYTYYYNPCRGLDYEKCASDSAMCGKKSDYFSIGTIQSEIIVIQGNNLSIQYSQGDGGRFSVVRLTCDMTVDSIPAFRVPKGEQSTLEYDFELITKCACYDACGSDGRPSSGGPEVGTGEVGIALIALVILVIAVYFVAGGIIMHVKFDKRGTEVIPQKQFWFDLPLLVRDGLVFTFSFVRCMCIRRNTYEHMA